MDKVDCVIVGAGVIGLAIAQRLAQAGREVIVLEAAEGIGTVTSSRNSEVIHAGIYYPRDSLMARFCVNGRQALYRYCAEHGCPTVQGQGSLPVSNITFEAARTFCETLGKRLPNAREWEKAARGGVESKRYPWGDRLDRNMANFLVDPALKPSHGTTTCRAYPPNGYGLFDMAGNVWEWVYDWYDPRYYGTAGARNPTGPPVGHLRLVRGGSWLVADVRMLSCSHRHKVPPDTYSYAIGFRVACSL